MDLYDFMGEIEIVEIKFSKLSLQKELLLKILYSVINIKFFSYL